MKKKVFISLILAISLSLLLSACSCKHEWTEATFTAPKTCSLCAETEGEPLPYSVSAEMIGKALKSKAIEEISPLLKTANSEGNYPELHASIMDFASAVVETIDWDGFVFLRNLVPELSSEYASELEQLLDANFENEALSFLSGEWIRLDNTNMDGCVIDIKVAGSSRIAMITDVSNIIYNNFGNYSFAVGDIKWNNIEVIDRNTIKYEDLSKGGTVGSAYETSLGILDYEKDRLTSHISSDLSIASLGNDQLWVRKRFAEANSENNVLAGEDFIIHDTLTSEEMNMLEMMGNKSFKYAFFYSLPEGMESQADELEARTFRGIEVGASLQEVEEAYGMGGKTTYAGTDDPFYNAFKLGSSQSKYKDFAAILETQVAYRVTYVGEDRDGPALSFLFDENDTVVAILLFNSRLEKNIELWQYSDGRLVWEWAPWAG